MINSVSGMETKGLDVRQGWWQRVYSRFTAFMKGILFEKGWLFYLVGFLLGRAVILSVVSPFAIAFLAAVWLIHRKRAPQVMLAILAGALSFSLLHSAFVTLAMLLFVLLGGIFKQVKRQQILIPVFVFIATAAPRLFIYSIWGQLTSYEWLLLAGEGVLGVVLVLIFMQSIPLLSPRRIKPALKNEEIVCLIILLASILTGTIGWDIYQVSIEQILSSYFVLLLAFVGGAAIGSTVGVVFGLILALANVANLYQMSLLAFSGLLGGLLKEGGKVGVSIGLLVGTFLVALYADVADIIPSLTETLIAITLFLLTPSSWIKRLSRYVPGTEAYTHDQEQYLQKVRNVTAKRVEQFSNVFEALSKSFQAMEETGGDDTAEGSRETDYFLSQVTEKTCQSCFLKERCWEQQFDKTYSLMEALKDDLEKGNEPNRQTLHKFENHCVKSKKVLNAMDEEISFFEANKQLKKQVTESKQFVSDQLQGVSEVMDDFAQEIMKEREHHEAQEMQIVNTLKDMGIALEKLDIYRLEKGNVDIEMTLSCYDYRGEGSKLIAPVLSDILDDMIVVKQEEVSPLPNGYCQLIFGSAKEYVVDTGIANAAKGGGFVSGDSYRTIELGEGKYAMAISDGMGNGERASEESEETLRLLQQILKTGIPESVAIKSINSILSLRTADEMYATLDLAVINLHNAFIQFLKIGSTPSFIKRGNDIITVEASNLPMGIVQEFDVDIVGEQLLPGDILIMMSDGIMEGPKQVDNTNEWLKETIRNMETSDPQDMADLILEEAVRTGGGAIDDDMTVAIAKMTKNAPQWTSIPVYPAITEKAQ